MDRLACVELPHFALQLLFRQHPDWAAWPAAVVAKESPQGEILQVNRHARQKGVEPGQRYGSALALAPSLRAAKVVTADVDQGVGFLSARLMRFTPEVEPLKEAPGTFYLKASGLWRLHRSPEHWAAAVQKSLSAIGFECAVTVGFSRFGTRALAQVSLGEVVVLPSPEDEAKAARQVRLASLALAPKVRSLLAKLGIMTVGNLLELPAAGLLERFGPELHLLHRQAAGELAQPFEAAPWNEPICRRVCLDEPESSASRLTFLVKSMLGPLLAEVAARHCALDELNITMVLEKRGESARETLREAVRPAAPTLDEGQLIDLVRLRLESFKLPRGVCEVNLEARGVPAEVEQLLLFADTPRRDLKAANRVLARLRAEFGDGAVLKARLTDGHLPEASFALEPLEHVAFPEVGPSTKERPLVRRIYARPQPLQSRPVAGPRGCHLLGMGHEPFSHLIGPYVVSGGWWSREVSREYYFAGTDGGRYLWVFYDRARRRWYAHGEVE